MHICVHLGNYSPGLRVAVVMLIIPRSINLLQDLGLILRKFYEFYRIISMRLWLN